MFKVRAVGGCYHHLPLEQVLTEVAAVELVAELVQVLLQKLRLDAVIHVGKQRLCVGYGNVYPWQHLAYVLRVDAPRLMLTEQQLEVVVRSAGICRDGTVRINGIHGLAVYRFLLHVGQDNHFDMPHLLGLLPALWIFRLRAFGNHQHLALLLAACSGLQLLLFLSVRRFSGEETFVQFNVAFKCIFVIALAHHRAQLVHHFPDWLIPLVP